jgi:DNA-damage-inducible protein J
MVGGLPFELKQPRYNAKTEAAIKEAKEIMAGQIEAKVYHSARELSEELDKEMSAGI